MKKLIGSKASPYVRRVRLMLANEKYDFECVNIFSPEGQERVAKYTTTARIPILVDRDTVIWDSFLIVNYLSGEDIPLEDQKELVLVNELTDAGVQLFQLRKFEIDTEDKGVFSKNNLKRIKKILAHFESKRLDRWSLVEQWLYCTLDWLAFREVYPWQEGHPQLVAFYKGQAERPEIKTTDPRL